MSRDLKAESLEQVAEILEGLKDGCRIQFKDWACSQRFAKVLSAALLNARASEALRAAIRTCDDNAVYVSGRSVEVNQRARYAELRRAAAEITGE